MKACARCGKPVPPPRRTYCTEGCADAAAHAKRLERFARGKWVPLKFRFYPKGEA